MAEEQNKLTVYFDGACPLCQREIAFISNQVPKEDVSFLDVSHEEATDLGQDLDRDTAMARFHVRKADGELLSGAAAFGEIWKQTRWMKPLGYLVSMPGLVHMFDWLYARFLIVRPRLQRLVASSA